MVIKKTWLTVDSQAPWTPRSSLPAPLSLECMWVLLMVPISSPVLSLEKVRYCWDHMNLLKSLYKLLRLWQASTEIYLSCSTQDKPCKFSSFLNLPPVNLEWSAYFSVYKGQLVNKHTSKGLLPFNCAREFHLTIVLCEGGLRAWHWRALLRPLVEVIVCGRDHVDVDEGGMETSRCGEGGWYSRSVVSNMLPPTGYGTLE